MRYVGRPFVRRARSPVQGHAGDPEWPRYCWRMLMDVDAAWHDPVSGRDLVVPASAGVPNEPSQNQGADGRSVRAFLDKAADIIVSFPGALLDDLSGIIRRAFGLAVEILGRAHGLVHFPLQFGPGVCGCRA